MKKFNFVIALLICFSISCGQNKKKFALLPFLLSLIKPNSNGSNLPANDGTSVTNPNPDDTVFASNPPSSNPNDPTYFGGGSGSGSPPPPVLPTDPPPISGGGPIVDTSNPVTGRVIKTTDIVDRYQDIVIEFSENMNRATVCNGEVSGGLTLKINGGATVPPSDMSCRWATDKQLLIRHYKSFLAYTKYDVIINNTAKPIIDSITRSFTVFTNPTDSINSTGGNTFSFRTESEFNPSSIFLNFNSQNYLYDNRNGMNLNSYGISSPANNVILTYSTTDFSRAEIIRLKKVGVDPTIFYEICNTGCPNNLTSLNLNTINPVNLRVSNGMNAYYLELLVRVTTTPLQYKRFYKTINFNWGNHVMISGPNYGPQAKIPNAGMLVLDKGQPSWAISTEGTLDVLGHFIEHYGSKYFTLNSDYGSPGIPVNESLNQMLKRNESTALPYLLCTDVLNLSKSPCMNWAFDGSKITYTQISPYGLFPTLQGYAINNSNGLPFSHISQTPRSPFSYLTQVGPFKNIQGRDRPYPVPNLTPLLASTISAGVEQMLTNALSGAIDSAILSLVSGIIGDIVGAVLGGLVGGLINIVNSMAPLRLVYDFDADAYIKQAVFGMKNPPSFSLGPAPWYNYSPNNSEEPDLLRANIDVINSSASLTGQKLDIKVKAREINAELMANLKVSNVDLEFFFIKLIPFDPFHLNVSSDPLDWFNEICVLAVCVPDPFSPKNWFDISGPGPVDFWFNMAWNRVDMTWVTSIIHGYYIARVFVDLNPSSNPPGGDNENIYRIARVQAGASTNSTSELQLTINPSRDSSSPFRIKDIQGSEWADNLFPAPNQGTIGSGLLINPLMMAASTDLSNASAAMNAVTPPPFPIDWIWNIIKSITGNLTSIIRGIVDAVLQDVLVTALPYVKPYIVEGLLSDFVSKVAANLFNSLLYPLGKGVYLTMPDIIPDPIGKFMLNLGIAIAPNSTGLAQFDTASGSKGLVAPVDVKLSGINTLLTGSGYNYSCTASDITAEKCPPIPFGNATGVGSFVRSRDVSNWNSSLPNPLKYSINNPGALLAIHPDAVGQFFFALWKNGGLNMIIDKTFLDKLALYRSEEKNEPIRLVRQLLKAENLFAVLIPSGVTDPALSGDVIYKAKDSGGVIQTVEKYDEIVIKLRPLQAPFVKVDPAPATPTYIPRLDLSLSDVEVQIFGKRGALEYRIIAFRLNLNTKATFGIGGFQGDSLTIPNPKRPNNIAIKLDICNDIKNEYDSSESKAIDCDNPNTNPVVNFSLVVTDITWNNQLANPYGVSTSGLGNLLTAVVKPALIPVFNHILGEIPLNPLGHCGIEVNQSYMKNPSNGINAKIIPIDSTTPEPMLLINARTEIFLFGQTTGSAFNQGAPLFNTPTTLTSGVPPKFTGTCDLVAP